MKILFPVYTPAPLDFDSLYIACSRFCRAAIADDGRELSMVRGDGYANFYIDEDLIFGLEDDEVDFIGESFDDPYFYAMECDDDGLREEFLSVLARIPGCIVGGEWGVLLPAAGALELWRGGVDWVFLGDS